MIEIGSADGGAVAAEITITEIVTHDEDDVGFLLILWQSGERAGGSGGEKVAACEMQWGIVSAFSLQSSSLGDWKYGNMVILRYENDSRNSG